MPILSECSESRDNNFNLIRFIAAVLVLYGHSYPVYFGENVMEPLWETIGMTWGSIAVDIFFITSGYLIAGSFFKRNLYDFAMARILRIYPALVMSVIFCVFIVGLHFTTNSVLDYLSQPRTYKYLLRNITLFFGVMHHLPGVFQNLPLRDAVNGSLWTLPYEVKMYSLLAIICQIILLFKKKTGCEIFKVLFLSIAVVSTFLNIINHFFYFAPTQFLRLFTMFFVGATFYIFRENIFLSRKIFFLIILLLVGSIIKKELFFIVYNCTISFLLIHLAYIPSGLIRSFNKIGDYSYGIYIYAFPIQQSVVAMENLTFAGSIVASIILTLIFSFLSWHLIEKKALQLKNNENIFRFPVYLYGNLKSRI